MNVFVKIFPLSVVSVFLALILSSHGIAEEIKTPQDSTYFIKKGTDREKNNKLQDATVLFNLAILADNSSMNARSKLGEIYRKRKLYDRAIIEHKKAKRVDPFFVPNLNNLALAYLKKGNFQESIREAQGALRIRPNSGLAHYSLAVAYDLTGQFNLARENLNLAIKLGYQNDPEHLRIVQPHWEKVQSSIKASQNFRK